MRRGAYLKQLELDLERWASLGLIDRDRLDSLRANAGPAVRHYSVSGILFLLGIILLACAVLIFIGANWQILPRIMRLGVALLLMWSAYGTAFALCERPRTVYADALVLLGSVLFGATIMLIGQMYHINAGWPNGVLLWAIGAFVAAALARARASAILAMILFGVWSAGISFADEWRIHWAFLAALAAMIALARMLDFRALAHLIVLSFLAWCAANGAVLADRLQGADFAFFVALMTTVGLVMWLGGLISTDLGARFGGLIAGYGLFFLTLIFFLLQLAEDGAVEHVPLTIAIFACGGAVAALAVAALAMRLIVPIDGLMAAAAIFAVLANCSAGNDWPAALNYLYAGLYLGYIGWLLTYGLRTQRTYAVNLAFVAFGGEVIYLYFVVFGTMLQQSALFAVGGILFLLAAYILERVRREVVRPARMEP